MRAFIDSILTASFTLILCFSRSLPPGSKNVTHMTRHRRSCHNHDAKQCPRYILKITYERVRTSCYPNANVFQRYYANSRRNVTRRENKQPYTWIRQTIYTMINNIITTSGNRFIYLFLFFMNSTAQTIRIRTKGIYCFQQKFKDGTEKIKGMLVQYIVYTIMVYFIFYIFFTIPV